MPWRLIFILLILTIFIVFAGFNTQLMTVSFGAIVLSNIPTFLALFIAFLIGALITLPFSIISMSKKNRIKSEIHKRELKATISNNSNPQLEDDEILETKYYKNN